MSWKSEFGPSWDVPPAIPSALADLSWSNDVSPSFGVEDVDGNGVRLWVNHPDPEMREIEGGRFLVIVSIEGESQEPEYEGDDLDTAMATYGRLTGVTEVLR